MGQMHLSDGGVRLLTVPNAGGTSVYSEAMSFEVLKALYQAELDRTEMEIEYCCQSKITDYSITIGEQKIGVSVTRAMHYGEGRFDEEEARRLLTKKLYGIIESTENVLKKDKWEKQILHIWAEDMYMAKICQDIWNEIDEELKSDSLVYITVAKNASWIFYEHEL
mmetsp:Transcript_8398/g.9369  ORF Transcript_8398/g.9369 Transcript_8398/m.9369 type:complete len:166 (-) Transcript_8398:47-544(-)